MWSHAAASASRSTRVAHGAAPAARGRDPRLPGARQRLRGGPVHERRRRARASGPSGITSRSPGAPSKRASTSSLHDPAGGGAIAYAYEGGGSPGRRRVPHAASDQDEGQGGGDGQAQASTIMRDSEREVDCVRLVLPHGGLSRRRARGLRA